MVPPRDNTERRERMAFDLIGELEKKNEEWTLEEFGECEAREIRNLNTGSSFLVQCDNKQCPICGMKKGTRLMYAIRRTMGPYPYIARIPNREDLDKALERAKNKKQRKGIEFKYVVVGDDRNGTGYILITDIPLHPSQAQMSLDAWQERIILEYRYGRRARLTRGLVRLSLLIIDTMTTRDKSAKYAMVNRDAWRGALDTELQLEANDANREEYDLIWKPKLVTSVLAPS